MKFEIIQRASYGTHPVLQGRPEADLELHGRAYYRKVCGKGDFSKMGLVVVYEGEAVAVGFAWDADAGGVWHGTGLEMPASLAVQAATGKAAFESLKGRRTQSDKIVFGSFVGLLPPHKAPLLGWMVIANSYFFQKLGCNKAFIYSLLPTLKGRPGMFANKEQNELAQSWTIQFVDIPADSVAVSDELRELDGSINLTLTDIKHMLGDDYLKLAATTWKLKTADEIRGPADVLAKEYSKWLEHTQPGHSIASRL